MRSGRIDRAVDGLNPALPLLVANGRHDQQVARAVTQWVKTGLPSQNPKLPPVEVIEVPREPNRPSGRRFGLLVHGVLGTIPLDADVDVIERLTTHQGRIIGATDEEVESAAKVVEAVLAHTILRRAREANAENRCRREVPVAWRESGAGLVEGVIDLAFREGQSWTVVDFKTDEEFRRLENYSTQVRLYGTAIQAATKQAASVILMRI